MFIRLGYDIEFDLPAPVAMVAMLSVHPSRTADLRAPDEMITEPASRSPATWTASAIAARVSSHRKALFG
jgi:hypothetical protein